jgi:hypothetical protein
MEFTKFILLYKKKFITMLISSFNQQSFNYAPYLFGKKPVQIRDQLFLYTDPVLLKSRDFW